jgi:selenocysteine lyase/cysteine desulfurase
MLAYAHDTQVSALLHPHRSCLQHAKILRRLGIRCVVVGCACHGPYLLRRLVSHSLRFSPSAYLAFHPHSHRPLCNTLFVPAA